MSHLRQFGMQLYLSVYTAIKQTHRAYCHSLWNPSSSDTNFPKQPESCGAEPPRREKVKAKNVLPASKSCWEGKWCTGEIWPPLPRLGLSFVSARPLVTHGVYASDNIALHTYAHGYVCRALSDSSAQVAGLGNPSKLHWERCNCSRTDKLFVQLWSGASLHERDKVCPGLAAASVASFSQHTKWLNIASNT